MNAAQISTQLTLFNSPSQLQSALMQISLHEANLNLLTWNK